MIICIITFLILILGIFAFVTRTITTKLSYKWRNIRDKHAPILGEYWVGFRFEEDKNPNYNEKLYKKAEKKYKFYNRINDNVLFGIGICGCILGGLFSLIFGLITLSINTFQSSEIEYLNMVETRSAYVRELEKNPENEHLYQDIINFNNSLRTTKMGWDNPWVSWFNNHKIAENIDYIEVENYDNNT